MQILLNDIIKDNKVHTKKGELADYIPELTKANPNALGICVYDLENNVYLAGDFNTKFTIQSVSKVIILACALMDKGREIVFSKVGTEPSADPFNSIIKLETRHSHKPLNPFINAGAIVCTSLVNGNNANKKFRRVLDMIRIMADNPNIDINYHVFQSEKLTGNTNRAIAYYLKGANIIEEDVEDVLDAYFKLCSIEATVEDVAKMAAVIGNKGISPWSNEEIVPPNVCKVLMAIMMTCGLYNASGEFAVNVGFPAKSGVGGCIMSVVPNKMGIAVIGPALDDNGNSVAGLKVLESLSQKLELSMF